MQSLQLTCVLSVVAVCAPASWAQISVVSQRYDNGRTGANLSETILNSSNVNVNQFGKLFTLSVSGSIYAEPLYVPGVAIAGGTHNVLYVATMNDQLYAFDADSNTGANANPLWHLDFTNAAAGITAVPIANITGSNALNIVGNVGIESTPVIDPASNTMYLVARTLENGTYVQRLHAVNILTGAELAGSPVVIQGSAGGQTFDPFIHNQRPSLALVNGKVIIAWASHEDLHAYHGWVMAYNVPSLTQAGVFCTTPSGTLGGIWQTGWAPAIDASGNAYYISGNGTWDGVANFGESFLKFATGSGLSLTDWFTPNNFSALNGSDADLGASGAMLIPGTSLVVGGGKQSLLYLLNTGSLGHESATNGTAVQVLNVGGGEIKGGPVYWNRSGGVGPWLYIWAANDRLKAYHFNGSTFDTTPVSEGSIFAPSGTSPGVLTVSANGSTVGSGVVWASIPVNQDADHGVVSGVMRAFNADNLTTELWNSLDNATRDDIITWPKWCPPMVANGKVYMGSFSNAVYVFGLLPSTPNFSLSVAAPAAATVTAGASAQYSLTIAALNGFAGSVALTVSGLPAGATATFNPASVSAAGTATLTVTTASTTPAGSATLTITGTSGSITHSATATLNVNAVQTPGFSLSAAPSTLTLAQGGTATSVITVTPTGGFTGTVSLSATGLPAGVTASFSGTTLTLSASGTATTGSATVIITGTSSALSHSITVALSVTTGGGTGGVTITPVVNANSPWFNEEDVRLSASGNLTALSITITIQATTGITFNGEYNTVGNHIVQTETTKAPTIVYQFSLSAGQSLSPGTYTFAAQTSGNGTVHPTSGDLFVATYTTVGGTFTQSGHF